jgi:hypothetical protein
VSTFATRGLGTPPNCEPYYDQRSLPRRMQPGAIAPVAPLDVDNFERFHAFGSIVCPGATGVATLVTSVTIPTGNQGKVVGLICFYDGSGNVEGRASDLFFSLRVNGSQFVRDYQTIPNTLGSLSSGPFPIPRAIKLFGGDLLELLVTVPIASPIATGAPNRMNGHLVGYYWPVGA